MIVSHVSRKDLHTVITLIQNTEPTIFDEYTYPHLIGVPFLCWQFSSSLQRCDTSNDHIVPSFQIWFIFVHLFSRETFEFMRIPYSISRNHFGDDFCFLWKSRDFLNFFCSSQIITSIRNKYKIMSKILEMITNIKYS